MKLVKKEKIGQIAVARFKRPDGTFFNEEITMELYHKLGEKGGAQFNPTSPDGELRSCLIVDRFDTADGTNATLADNEYAENGSHLDGKKRLRVKIKDAELVDVEEDDIVNDDIDDALVAEIKTKHPKKK